MVVIVSWAVSVKVVVRCSVGLDGVIVLVV